MKGTKALICLFCMFGFLLTARAQKTLVKPADLLADSKCTAFEWDALEGVTERGAIRVPVTLDGRTYWYQLDTGADATIIYGAEAERWGWRKGAEWVRVPAISLGGSSISAAMLYVMADMKTKPGSTAGTVGLDLLLGQIAVLDYPGKRFCLIRRADAPEELRLHKRGAWVSAEIRDGKFFVHSKLNGQVLKDVFFDTGASAFPLMVDFETWKTLTGKVGEADASTRIVGNSWGKPMPFIGAPATGALQVGPLQLPSPIIFYRGTEPDHFKKYPYPATGLLGNAPFWNDVIVLDLGVHPAFGILR
jgi:hypothetical protein